MVEPVDNISLLLVCQDLVPPGKERLVCFRNNTVELKFLFDFSDDADGGIAHGKENWKPFDGNLGNLLAKIRNAFVSVSQISEVRSDQNSVWGGRES
jgi:nuclear transport factor 2 (NTF2) superfamily protein